MPVTKEMIENYARIRVEAALYAIGDEEPSERRRIEFSEAIDKAEAAIDASLAGTEQRERLPYDLRLRIGEALDCLICVNSTPEQVDEFISTFADFGLAVSYAADAVNEENDPNPILASVHNDETGECEVINVETYGLKKLRRTISEIERLREYHAASEAILRVGFLNATLEMFQRLNAARSALAGEGGDA